MSARPRLDRMKYDIFISHASEDKDEIARPLAQHLIGRGFRVWLDEMELCIGDSLRRRIDEGLANSSFGVVVLSPSFFRKEWPNKELDGLVAREDGKATVILPIWHNVCRDDIVEFSPPLADKLAAPTSKGLHHVVDQVVKAVTSRKRANAGNVPAEQRLPVESEKGHSIDDLILQVIDRVSELAEHGAEPVTGVRTGFIDLDGITAGLQPGTLNLLAGRPETGKTTFALEVAQHVATVEGLPVVVFAPATSARQTADRLLCLTGNISQARLRIAALSDDEWGRLPEAVDRLGRSALFVYDSPDTTIAEVKVEVGKRARLSGALGAVVVDSLQELMGGVADDSAAICRELKKLAREYNCPILLTSHLTRTVETRADKRPYLSDLKEVGEIDPYTDVVLFLYRDSLYSWTSLEPDVVEVIVAKQRESGVVATVKLALSKDAGRLVNLAPPDVAGAESPNLLAAQFERGREVVAWHRVLQSVQEEHRLAAVSKFQTAVTEFHQVGGSLESETDALGVAIPVPKLSDGTAVPYEAGHLLAESLADHLLRRT